MRSGPRTEGCLARPVRHSPPRPGRRFARLLRSRREGREPHLLFPNGFDPRTTIFNAHRIVEGDLFIVRDPLQVLTAHESGIENVVAFLAENVMALQLEQLAALMDDRKCERMEMFWPAQAGLSIPGEMTIRVTAWACQKGSVGSNLA